MSLFPAHPILLQSGGLTIYTHGAFFALGGVVGALVLAGRVRALKLLPSQAIGRVLVIFLVGLFAARLGYLLTYPDTWTSVGQLFALWEGGLVSYFGIAGGLLAAFIFARRLPLTERLVWFDAVVISGLVAWAIGRWGNYYAFESYGVLAWGWGGFYGRVPIQLFESLWCLAIAVVLLRKKLTPGMASYWGLLAYFFGRLVIDFWRDEGQWLGIHASQWVSGFALVGLTVLYLRFRKSQA